MEDDGEVTLGKSTSKSALSGPKIAAGYAICHVYSPMKRYRSIEAWITPLYTVR